MIVFNAPLMLLMKCKYTYILNVRNVFAIVACLPGYYGMNCSSQCPFPSFGVLCSDTCQCNATECHHGNGCRKRTTVGKYANRITTIECLLHKTERNTLVLLFTKFIIIKMSVILIHICFLLKTNRLVFLEIAIGFSIGLKFK